MGRLSRRNVLKVGAVAGIGAAVSFEAPSLFSGASASSRVRQTALSGASIPRFVTPLPTFAGRRSADPEQHVSMLEFQQRVLPDSFYRRLPAPFRRGTYLWGYAVGERHRARP